MAERFSKGKSALDFSELNDHPKSLIFNRWQMDTIRTALFLVKTRYVVVGIIVVGIKQINFKTNHKNIKILGTYSTSTFHLFLFMNYLVSSRGTSSEFFERQCSGI